MEAGEQARQAGAVQPQGSVKTLNFTMPPPSPNSLSPLAGQAQRGGINSAVLEAAMRAIFGAGGMDGYLGQSGAAAGMPPPQGQPWAPTGPTGLPPQPQQPRPPTGPSAVGVAQPDFVGDMPNRNPQADPWAEHEALLAMLQEQARRGQLSGSSPVIHIGDQDYQFNPDSGQVVPTRGGGGNPYA